MPDGDEKRRARGRPFEKGRSGNPQGRRRKTVLPEKSPLDIVLEKTVPFPGEEGLLTVPEAAKRRTFQDALEGKTRAMRTVVGWYRKWEAWEEKRQSRPAKRAGFVWEHDPRNLDRVLQLLDIAQVDEDREVDEYSPHLRVRSWAVEAALKRRRSRTGFSDTNWQEITRCSEPGTKLKRPQGRDE
jgi:hypothetical protein